MSEAAEEVPNNLAKHVFGCSFGFYHTIYCVSKSIQVVFQWPQDECRKCQIGLTNHQCYH